MRNFKYRIIETKSSCYIAQIKIIVFWKTLNSYQLHDSKYFSCIPNWIRNCHVPSRICSSVFDSVDRAEGALIEYSNKKLNKRKKVVKTGKINVTTFIKM